MSENPDTIPPVEGVDPAEVHVIDLNDAMTPPDKPVETLLADAIGHWDAKSVQPGDEVLRNEGIGYSLMEHLPDVPNVMENQCHAYSKNGQRCESMAGHPGFHEVSFEWAPEDCWTPGTPSTQVLINADRAAEGIPPLGVSQEEYQQLDTPMPSPAPAEPEVHHLSKEGGIPVVYSTDVPDRLEVPDPNDPCVACEGCRRAHHPGGGKCVRCGTCVRYVG